MVNSDGCQSVPAGGGGPSQWEASWKRAAEGRGLLQSYLIRVFVNQGSSAMGGTAESIRGWDLMNDKVSSGKSIEVL